MDKEEISELIRKGAEYLRSQPLTSTEYKFFVPPMKQYFDASDLNLYNNVLGVKDKLNRKDAVKILRAMPVGTEVEMRRMYIYAVDIVVATGDKLKIRSHKKRGVLADFEIRKNDVVELLIPYYFLTCDAIKVAEKILE